MGEVEEAAERAGLTVTAWLYELVTDTFDLAEPCGKPDPSLTQSGGSEANG